MNELVHLSGVIKAYGRQPALLDVSLDLQPGRIVGLLGPNGAGKTTLIKLLNGLLQPDAGVVEIDGTAPGGLHESHRQLSARPPLSGGVDEGIAGVGSVPGLLRRL